jgi:hypothetical protein
MVSLEKAEIAQDGLAMLLGGAPEARPAPPNWRETNCTPNRSVWNAYVGQYDGPLTLYRDGDRLDGVGSTCRVEPVAPSDTRFVMLVAGAPTKRPSSSSSKPTGA